MAHALVEIRNIQTSVHNCQQTAPRTGRSQEKTQELSVDKTEPGTTQIFILKKRSFYYRSYIML